MDTLLNITSIDGRYNNLTKDLLAFFSEYGLFRYRLIVEVNYIYLLCNKLKLTIDQDKLFKIIYNFNYEECIKIKEIENNIKHDVKSVEKYLHIKFNELNIPYKNLIHFGLTSQDINNVSISLSIKDYLTKIYKPNIIEIITKIHTLMKKSDIIKYLLIKY